MAVLTVEHPHRLEDGTRLRACDTLEVSAAQVAEFLDKRTNGNTKLYAYRPSRNGGVTLEQLLESLDAGAPKVEPFVPAEPVKSAESEAPAPAPEPTPEPTPEPAADPAEAPKPEPALAPAQPESDKPAKKSRGK